MKCIPGPIVLPNSNISHKQNGTFVDIHRAFAKVSFQISRGNGLVTNTHTHRLHSHSLVTTLCGIMVTTPTAYPYEYSLASLDGQSSPYLSDQTSGRPMTSVTLLKHKGKTIYYCIVDKGLYFLS